MKPLGKEHNKKALRHLHSQGVEMTLEEITAHRKAAYVTIRREMRLKGYTMPESDVEMFLLLREMASAK